MACGKPPEPGKSTPPSSRPDFALKQVYDLLKYVEIMISTGDLGVEIGSRMASAERAIARLQSSGRPDSQIRKLEGRLKQLKGAARGAIRREAVGLGRESPLHEKFPTGEAVVKRFANGVPEKSVRTAIEALTKPEHLAHQDFKTEALRVIEANGKVPEEYKVPLVRDIATLLRVCPSAGGLVTAMVTRGQPRGSFLRRFTTKGNDAVGAAFEIMGTAALCKRASTPANTKHKAPDLRIDPTKDQLVFGNKAHLNHRYEFNRRVGNRDRRTVEADAQLFQNGREIAIDFKHVKEGRTRPNSTELRNQLKAVARAITHGHFDEFHFVTNGKFSESFKVAVEKVNDELVACGNDPIACHEYVNSIEVDPHTDGEA